ncbi:hypothetical protein NKW53_12920 [Acetobacter orientalis]|nr:hypothetical protein [Acetobacter orientalis]MCP1216965.1 hypothetical protein [Acetobacter orientalis]MCP1219869.1 hypothetical protein [Acetobacter orientalis]
MVDRRHILDDGAGLRQHKSEEFRCRLEKIDGAGSFIKINVCGQYAGFEIGRNRVEIIGWRKRPFDLSLLQEFSTSSFCVGDMMTHKKKTMSEQLSDNALSPQRIGVWEFRGNLTA